MIMKTMLVSAVLLCGVVGAAHAETFTFKSTGKVVNTVMVPTGPDTTAGAVFQDVDTQTTYASGKTLANKGQCASWSMEPGNQFDVAGVCTFTEGTADKASIQWSCVNPTQTSGDCWGALRGDAGRFAGKTGTILWHFTGSEDGKTGSSVGAGMWND